MHLCSWKPRFRRASSCLSRITATASVPHLGSVSDRNDLQLLPYPTAVRCIATFCASAPNIWVAFLWHFVFEVEPKRYRFWDLLHLLSWRPADYTILFPQAPLSPRWRLGIIPPVDGSLPRCFELRLSLLPETGHLGHCLIGLVKSEFAPTTCLYSIAETFAERLDTVQSLFDSSLDDWLHHHISFEVLLFSVCCPPQFSRVERQAQKYNQHHTTHRKSTYEVTTRRTLNSPFILLFPEFPLFTSLRVPSVFSLFCFLHFPMYKGLRRTGTGDG